MLPGSQGLHFEGCLDGRVKDGRGSGPKVTLCLSAVVMTTSGAVARIVLGSVCGSDAANETVGDAQQSAVFPAPSPQGKFDTRHPVPGPLLGGEGGVPRRPGGAACAG